MCKQNQELIPYLFLYCGFSRSLWEKVFTEFDLTVKIPASLYDLFGGCCDARWNKKVKALWVYAVWAVLWGIWKEKNARLFSDEYNSAFILWDKILFWMAIWIKSHQDLRLISFFDLSMGWSFLLH